MAKNSKCLVLFLLGSVFLTNACGLFKDAKDRGSRKILPKTDEKLQYDVSALEGVRDFEDTNPFVALKMDLADEGIGLCSGFIIGPRRVLTNYHCVEHGGYVLPAGSIVVLGRRVNDSEARSVKASRILGGFQSEDEVDEEKMDDWALLEMSEDMSEFGQIDLETETPSQEELETSVKATVFNIDPPESIRPPMVSRLRVQPLSFDSHKAFEQKNLDSKSYELKSACRLRVGYNASKSSEFEACDDLEFTKEDAFKAFKNGEIRSVRTQNARIRHGNSGSAIVRNGKAIGIIHSMIQSTFDQGEYSMTGLGQWMPAIAETVNSK